MTSFAQSAGATRQSETLAPQLGPCMTWWVRTIGVQQLDGGFRNGVCHDDQARCLADPQCEAALVCVTPCRDAACVNAFIGEIEPQPSRSLFLDWSRCFADECAPACPGPSDATGCVESHR